MINIEKEFAQVEATKFELGADRFFSNSHKKQREWQILGAVQRQLLSAGQTAPTLAEVQESPDFATYSTEANLWSYVEITEVLRPEYRRQEFFKEDAKYKRPRFYDVDPVLPKPWEPLRELISKKARKRYQKPILLIVYHDISRSSFQDWSKPFHQQLLDEHAASPFVNIAQFDRLLILNCDMKSLVELHPMPGVIVPDDPFACSYE